jgi:Zn-dependent protease/CBS domain-containing protein
LQPESDRAVKEERIPGSIGAFTAFGVPVRFHFTFLLILIFLVFVAWEDRESAAGDVIFIASLFVSVLLHELGHALVAKHHGVRTIEIVMFPIGGVARLEKNPPARSELWIAAAGPLVNLVIAAALLGTLAFFKPTMAPIESLADATDENLLERIAYGNLILALFNLLPAFPMDGGRILRSLLARWQPEDRATRIASGAGRLLAIAMGLYGLLSANFMLLFIAFFVYLGAAQEGQAAMGRSLAHGIPVSAAMMTRYHALSHGATIRDAAQLLIDTSEHDFPVQHGDQVLGLLDRNALLRALATQGPETYVAAVMDRNPLRVDQNMDLAEALERLAAAGPAALVMDGDRLAGLLTRENLTEFLLLRRIGVFPATLRPRAE